MHIRSLISQDIPQCVEIVSQNFDASVAARAHEELWTALSSAGQVMGIKHLVAVEGPGLYHDCGRVLGFAGMMPSWIMHGVWDFIWINVLPEAHGQGIGTELTRQRLSCAQAAGARVVHLVTEKPFFFARLGFSSMHCYSGCKWVAMCKQFEPLAL